MLVTKRPSCSAPENVHLTELAAEDSTGKYVALKNGSVVFDQLKK